MVNVWVAEWDNRPTEVYATFGALTLAIQKDFESGYFVGEDIEYYGSPCHTVLIDEWLSAHEVKIIE